MYKEVHCGIVGNGIKMKIIFSWNLTELHIACLYQNTMWSLKENRTDLYVDMNSP